MVATFMYFPKSTITTSSSSSDFERISTFLFCVVHQLCMQGAAFVTLWRTWYKKHWETPCKLNQYPPHGQLHSIFKLWPSSASGWTMMQRKVLKMAQHWKPENIEIEVYIVFFSFFFFPFISQGNVTSISCMYLNLSVHYFLQQFSNSCCLCLLGFCFHKKKSCEIALVHIKILYTIT